MAQNKRPGARAKSERIARSRRRNITVVFRNEYESKKRRQHDGVSRGILMAWADVEVQEELCTIYVHAVNTIKHLAVQAGR